VLWLAAGVLVAQEVRARGAGRHRRAARRGRRHGRGDRAGTAADRRTRRGAAGAVSEAGAEAVASARAARESARRLALLLGLAIAAIPSLPVLLLYLPTRIGTARERRELGDALAAGDPAVDELLAWRAVAQLPYRTLSRVSDDPVRDLEEGDHAALADAELAWFGVERPDGSAA